ncbi:hypothetical protein WMY93_026128 [Mugilogobius chulae]|uniref:Myb/SANT-like DNA-binding domain-containing protein n=1 Tax=Mugilogobius chulae TaxID=88201 RepID=A0AAW0N3A6_9GOBI
MGGRKYPKELDKTHKNAVVYGKISEELSKKGFNRSIEQCREKSDSSSEEKEKFHWFDALDNILANKPCSAPTVLESAPSRDTSTTDTSESVEKEMDEDPSISNTSMATPSVRRKRRRSDAAGEAIKVLLEEQRLLQQEFLQTEEERHHRRWKC